MDCDNVEVLDLVDVESSVKYSGMLPGDSRRRTEGWLKEVGKAGSEKTPETAPSSRALDNLTSNRLFTHHGDDNDDESDREFPSPTALLHGEDCFDYGGEDFDLMDWSAGEELERLKGRESSDGTPRLTSSFANGVFNFSAFENDTKTEPSASKKRDSSTELIRSQVTRARVDEEKKVSSESKPALPDWVNDPEIDPEFVKFFEGYVDFV